MRQRAHLALYFAAAQSLSGMTGCPQLRDDDFGLVSGSSQSGAGGSAARAPALSGSNGAAGDQGREDAGAIPEGPGEGGAASIGSSPAVADAAAEGGAPPPSVCGEGSLGPDGATCYYVSAVAAAWRDARQACLDAGRLLVQIDSAEEDTFVANTSELSLWIGASDTAVEGSFVWSDGSPITFSNWAPNQPDDFEGPDCIEKRQVTDEPWYDQPCDGLERYVCESPAE